MTQSCIIADLIPTGYAGLKVSEKCLCLSQLKVITIITDRSNACWKQCICINFAKRCVLQVLYKDQWNCLRLIYCFCSKILTLKQRCAPCLFLLFHVVYIHLHDKYLIKEGFNNLKFSYNTYHRNEPIWCGLLCGLRHTISHFGESIDITF